MKSAIICAECEVMTLKTDITPYWDSSCLVRSSHLWSPEDLPKHSSPLVIGKGLSGSWFLADLSTIPRKNSQEVSSVLFTYSSTDPTDSGDVGLRCRKIRIYPNAQERDTLNAWLLASRYAYNEAVARLKQHQGPTPNWKGDFPKSILKDLPAFIEAPFQVKHIAVRDAIFALKEGKKRVKRGIIPNFTLQFRSRKSPVQSFFVPGSAIRKNGAIYPRLMGSTIKSSEPLPEARDSRIIKQNNKWYICIPRNVQQREAENQGRVVAIDPGVRNFITLFSEQVFGHIGKGDIGKIVTLCKHLDNLLSRSKLRKSYLRAAARMRDRIRNLVSELHWKAALFLVQNFDVIFLPDFKTSEMVPKKSRKIRKKSVRSMLTLSHYKFSQRLTQKAWEYGKVVVRVSEAYTSKTNSWTGEIMPRLGGAKNFLFQGVPVDRDLNGARGIFLRALRDTSFESAVLEAGAPSGSDSLLSTGF